MGEKKTETELWRRKFEPVTDWKPAAGMSSPSSGTRALIEEALEGLGKSKDALTKILEPFSEDAKTKIKDLVGNVEEIASKSSTEARTFLANILGALEQKIRPKQ
ncbi:MAG: hypothetical protein LDL33_10250 [Desulfomonile sp.]|nr:hypothetical protein [Desulfomonile sp.]